ncbi:MAG: SPOR domain-containing protein [Betaproteobacteria bacterium]|nr:SPOR domain-containing protein [Betaproteobacteria bacterium]
MSQDVKSRATASGGSKMNPMFLGIIIGLLLGITIALGVALWLNRSALPSLEKAKESKPSEMAPKLEAKTPPSKPDVAKAEAGKDTTDKDGGKPRFEFYQILPGKDGEKDGKAVAKPDAKSAKPAERLIEKPADKAAEKPTEKAVKPVDKLAQPAQNPREIYYLQAGAFQNLADADNLKARIALIGLSASVTAANIPDKGVLHRVRLGPYQSLEPVNRIKTALSDAGIPATVVKTTDVLN